MCATVDSAAAAASLPFRYSELPPRPKRAIIPQEEEATDTAALHYEHEQPATE